MSLDGKKGKPKITKGSGKGTGNNDKSASASNEGAAVQTSGQPGQVTNKKMSKGTNPLLSLV
jgi:hypothetical protein